MMRTENLTMPKFEHWADAYERILEEVKAEHPDWDERQVYAEYRARCQEWKRERGIRDTSGVVS